MGDTKMGANALYSPMAVYAEIPVVMAYETSTLTPCPSCGSRETIRVAMTLAGASSTFVLCNACEWRGWSREGETLPLGSVLSMVANR
jgi:predicted RNA-binding Zn-ribbon protein involved in translation (DUF1610 family)